MHINKRRVPENPDDPSWKPWRWDQYYPESMKWRFGATLKLWDFLLGNFETLKLSIRKLWNFETLKETSMGKPLHFEMKRFKVSKFQNHKVSKFESFKVPLVSNFAKIRTLKLWQSFKVPGCGVLPTNKGQGVRRGRTWFFRPDNLGGPNFFEK